MSQTASFGELVRHHRVKTRLTQVSLARQAGVAQSYVTALETGRKPNPSRVVALRLAEAMSLADAERQQFLLAAHYVDSPAATPTVEAAHPLNRAIAQFLALPPKSPKLSETLWRVICELLGAALHRGADQRERYFLKTAGLAGLGYFHDGGVRGAGKSGRRRDDAISPNQARLANQVAELLRLVAQPQVPIARRIRLLKDLTSLAAWQLSQDGGGRKKRDRLVRLTDLPKAARGS